MLNLIKLLRPNQYIKNIFIFIPLFFGRFADDPIKFMETIWAFVAFSLLASSVYVINDMKDRENDQKHPKKKERPLAKGTVSIRTAAIVAVFLVVLSFMIFSQLEIMAFSLALFYLVINILYSIKLKQFPVIDVLIVAFGFVVRLEIGSVVSGVQLSDWIMLMTFLLSLFIAIAKRRDDVVIYLETGVTARKVAQRYNITFLNIALYVLFLLIHISYVMFTLDQNVIDRYDNKDLWITVILVALGMTRYLYITFAKKESGSPTELLLTDRYLQVTVLGWILFFGAMIYIW